jgi:hypothetical protein
VKENEKKSNRAMNPIGVLERRRANVGRRKSSAAPVSIVSQDLYNQDRLDNPSRRSPTLPSSPLRPQTSLQTALTYQQEDVLPR